MSVYISEKHEDELNSLFLIDQHPLVTLDNQTDDDVCYLKIPYNMLEKVKHFIDHAIAENRGMNVLFSANLQLRHNFDFSSQRKIQGLATPEN